MTSEQPLIPPVIWAQRNDVVFVTICVEDCLNPGVKIESEQIIFRGVAGLQKKIYAITIPLYSEVVVEKSKTSFGGRYVEIVLAKPEDNRSYWPHLTKEKKKYHWLKVDFKKWKDEDDSGDDDSQDIDPRVSQETANLDQMLSMMGGGSKGGKDDDNYRDLGNMEDDDSTEDSDDEEMPELDDIESENAGRGKEKNEGKVPDLGGVKPAPTA
ncbi:protein wos2 [Sipha flava]|uniref:Protein wos2 n=1 Tax=Sipha flava TaxID=143950 RepID=A0A8B8FNX7_9HEMI|nr:protein wos2 [Sipha flava]